MSTHQHRPPIKQDSDISNHSLAVTAICCVFLVAFMALAFLIWYRLSPVGPEQISESTEQAEVLESVPQVRRTYFDEGYSIVLPAGFTREKKEETRLGYTVYRYRTPEGYQFIFAIVPDPSITRFTPPPKDYSETLIKGIPGLNEGLDGELLPQRVVVDSMSANVFRFYEKETFRGVNFTDCMAVIVPEHLLLLKFSGKYGNYNEKDANIVMEDDWYNSLLSLRRVRESESNTRNNQGPSKNKEVEKQESVSESVSESVDSNAKADVGDDAKQGDAKTGAKKKDTESSDSANKKGATKRDPNASKGVEKSAELGLKLVEPKP